MRLPRTAALSVILLAAGAAQAGGWNEAIDGDLSNNYLAPTPIYTLGLGPNLIAGTTGQSPDNVVDRDYFSFTVPAGHELTGLWVLAGTEPIGFGSFIGFSAGSVVGVGPEEFTAEGLLGWTLYNGEQVGTNLLVSMNTTEQGSSGYTLPLPAGTYSFWVQEGSYGTGTYNFDLRIAAVPEAPTAVLALIGGLGLLAARRRRG